MVFIFSANRYDGATEIIGDQNMNDGDFLNDRSNENTEIIEVVKPITNGRLSALNRLPLEAYSNESENKR